MHSARHPSVGTHRRPSCVTVSQFKRASRNLAARGEGFFRGGGTPRAGVGPGVIDECDGDIREVCLGGGRALSRLVEGELKLTSVS
jgi:hypothetical protein